MLRLKAFILTESLQWLDLWVVFIQVNIIIKFDTWPYVVGLHQLTLLTWGNEEPESRNQKKLRSLLAVLHHPVLLTCNLFWSLTEDRLADCYETAVADSLLFNELHDLIVSLVIELMSIH